MDGLDLAVIGAGAAGTWVARAVQRARPDWSIALFERHDRIGGRLRSVRVPGLEHPIELGGMRYLTSHRRVQSVVTDLEIATRPFDPHGGTERSFLRGVFGDGPADPNAGAGYDLRGDEYGRSALELAREGFNRIVPDAESLDAEGWRRARATGRYLDRRLIDWSFAEAMATVHSPEGHRFTVDAFGYDSGIRPHNIGTAIEYLLGGNDPNIEARVPVDGMDAIPKALASRFQELGGTVHLGHDLQGLAVDEGIVQLAFHERGVVTARRVVLALPVPALRALGNDPRARGLVQSRTYEAIEGFPATKLYLWFDRPWWRHPTSGPKGIRTTTDLPIRKTFYFDTDPDAPAAILASYTDGLDSEPIVELAGGASNGEPAPAPLLAAALRQLRTLHPYADIPEPAGSAFMHWGSDRREIGWCYWLAGYNPDAVMPVAIQPEPSVPIFICGESFSRAQAWVEGALETAEAATERLLA
jgi:monoamine oxidase